MLGPSGLPAPSDVRNLLAGFPGIQTGQKTLVLNGTTLIGSALITGIDTTQLDSLMRVTGAGIPTSPALTYILAISVVDPVYGQLMLTQAATASATVALTFTFNAVVTDQWFQNALNGEVLPLIQRWCRQTFNAIQTYVEYYDGTGSSILVLRRKPVVALINLSYTNVDSNLYYLTPSAMQIISDEGILKAKANFNESTYTPIFWKGQKNLRVTYTAGFASCPVDIATAILYLLAESALGIIADQTGGGGLSIQGYNRDYGKRGRYSNIRNTLARKAYSLLRLYMIGTTS